MTPIEKQVFQTSDVDGVSDFIVRLMEGDSEMSLQHNRSLGDHLIKHKKLLILSRDGCFVRAH